MPSKREQVILAVAALLKGALPKATHYRNEEKQQVIPAGGYVNVEDGDPGEPEVSLNPTTWIYEHAIPVDVAANATRAGQPLGSVVSADFTYSNNLDKVEVTGRRSRETQSRGAGLVTHAEIADRKAGGGEAGPSGIDTHSLSAGLSDTIVGCEVGEGEVGHPPLGAQIRSADLANQIAELREQWRRRQAWHRAEKSLALQAKALCRRLAEGGCKKEAEVIYRAALGKGTHQMASIALAAMLPLDEARKAIEAHRKAVEKRLTKLAAGLPVAGWVEGTRGVGLLSLAAIVGEAGDLDAYANPAKLWKRLGLAVMPDGTRQRLVAGAAALDHGYSPTRRSVVWNIGSCIVKAGGPLKAVYDARKVYEAERVETKAHAHNRAQRYVEKRFLRDLWSVWRKGGGGHPGIATQAHHAAPAT